VYLEAGSPGKKVSGAWGLSGLQRVKIGDVSGKKRCSGGQQAALSGAQRGKSPLFCGQRGWLELFLAGKQPVKDGGVCRVIGPSPGEAGAVSSPFPT